MYLSSHKLASKVYDNFSKPRSNFVIFCFHFQWRSVGYLRSGRTAICRPQKSWDAWCPLNTSISRPSWLAPGRSVPARCATVCFKYQLELGKFCNKSFNYLQRFLAASMHFILPANLHLWKICELL